MDLVLEKGTRLKRKWGEMKSLLNRKNIQALVETSDSNLFTDSRISLVCGDSQAQGVTWEVPRKSTSLERNMSPAALQAPPCCGISIALSGRQMRFCAQLLTHDWRLVNPDVSF